MKVDYFGDDFGLGMYTFTEATLAGAIKHLQEQKFFDKEYNSQYQITNIILKRKYWLFGALTIKIIAETEEAIKKYGGGYEPRYYIKMV